VYGYAASQPIKFNEAVAKTAGHRTWFDCEMVQTRGEKQFFGLEYKYNHQQLYQQNPDEMVRLPHTTKPYQYGPKRSRLWSMGDGDHVLFIPDDENLCTGKIINHECKTVWTGNVGCQDSGNLLQICYDQGGERRYFMLFRDLYNKYSYIVAVDGNFQAVPFNHNQYYGQFMFHGITVSDTALIHCFNDYIEFLDKGSGKLLRSVTADRASFERTFLRPFLVRGPFLYVWVMDSTHSETQSILVLDIGSGKQQDLQHLDCQDPDHDPDHDPDDDEEEDADTWYMPDFQPLTGSLLLFEKAKKRFYQTRIDLTK
jgi:hypothetical protein